MISIPMHVPLTMEYSKRDEVVIPSSILQPSEGYDYKDFLSAELLLIFDQEPYVT